MEPRVVVVGAGLAGLTCAYRLAHREVPVDLYEARDRIGGRCWSSDDWPDGQAIEHGGELIEDWQPSILALVEEFGLELEHRTTDGGPGVLILDGKTAPLADVTGLPKVLARIDEELAVVGDPTAAAPSDEARALDALTQTAWLDANVDDPRLRHTLGRLIAIIDGRSTDEASALAIHALLGNLASTGMELSDVARKGLNDLMHVRGGNDRIAKELAGGLPDDALRLNSALRTAERTSDGFRLGFSDGTETDASRVVLATPVPALRKVDTKRLDLSETLRGAIDDMPMGLNTKLILGFDRRPEHHPNWDGHLTYLEDGIAAWSTSSGQEGDAGILTLFTEDRRFAPTSPHGEPSEDVVRDALALVDIGLPGISETFNGRAWLDSWPDDEWAGGSYSVFAPGQYTRYAGKLGEEQDGLHVAGEHTSVGSQGYLDGAIESGERVAREVLAAFDR
jgi:monoamine oxidase